MFFIAFIIGKGYNLDKFIILIQEDFFYEKNTNRYLASYFSASDGYGPTSKSC